MSEDFILFEQELEKYFSKNRTISDSSHNEKIFESSCVHENVITEKGISVCTDCGEEIQNKISSEKEWRYYGNSDSKHGSDPTRVQMRKIDDRNIYKDVENMGFSESIVSMANIIYSQVTKGKIFRGNSRKAIIFACIFHAFKISGLAKSHESLITIFGLTRKNGLKGLKLVNRSASKDSKIRTTYITPVNLLDEIMDIFSASDEQKQEVINLYKKVKNKSSKLNRSRPQSVSSGLVYYWIKLKNKDITLKEFAKKVSLSELTVTKIAKEIATVLSTPGIFIK